MRRRRQGLKVDTFPFLAVLLCAMGSLILLLLVLDRRARAVAVRKAREAATRLALEDEKTLAARREELERRRQALHALLAQEYDEVQSHLRSVLDEARATGQSQAVAEAKHRELEARVAAERNRLSERRQRFASRQTELVRADKKSKVSEAELARMKLDLEQLELTLLQIKAARRQQQHTYSLVPFRGRHGENRRPLYLECTASGVIFHPERMALEGPGVLAMDVRKEVERRVQRHREVVKAAHGKPEDSAYLLMLIRPDGVVTYYKILAALQGLQLDFGYEFVDRDWTLEFPPDDTTPAAQPWMTASPSPVAVPSGKPATPGRRRVAGVDFNANAPGEAPRPPIAASPADPQVFGGAAGPLEARGVPVPGGAIVGGGYSRGNATPAGGPEGRSGPTGPAVARGGVIPNPPPRGGNNPPNRSASAPSSQPRGHDSSTSLGPLAASKGGGFLPGPSGSDQGNSVSPSLPPPVRGAGGEAGQEKTLPEGESAGTAIESGRQVTPRSRTEMVPATAGNSSSIAREDRPPGGGVPDQPPENFTPRQVIANTGSVPKPQDSPPLSQDPGSTAEQKATGTPSPLPAMVPTSPQPRERGASKVAAGGSPPGQGTEAQSGDPESVGPDLAPNPLARLLPADPAKKPARPLPPRPSSVYGNRDWVIGIECVADGVLLLPTGARVSLTTLYQPGNSNSLQEAVRQLVARRQATVRPGEPPYRPQIRFLVRPNGFRSYYLAYPALEALAVPMSRENLDPDEDVQQKLLAR